MLSKVLKVWREEGLQGVKRRILRRLPQPRSAERNERRRYQEWIALYDTLTDADRQAIRAAIEEFEYKPLISVVMPVYETEERWLRRAIESVCEQLYPHWELCLADDNSRAPHVRRVLEEYAQKDERIKVVFRRKNGHISAASNSALELASGEFVALLDHDDELAEHALYMIAEEINTFPEADLIYSDEDKFNPEGERVKPHFKTDWSPDLFRSYNFISHLGVYRARLVKEIGGFREGYEGSQDYDLALRFVERTPERNIRHIPHVLYHWRELPTSVGFDVSAKAYAHENARRAIRSHFERTGTAAKVVPGYFIFHRAVFTLPSPPPTVSLIMVAPAEEVFSDAVVEGLLNQTHYEQIELAVVVPPGAWPTASPRLESKRRDVRVKLIPCEAPFNLSAAINATIRESAGEVIALVGCGLKAVSPGWLQELVSQAARPEVGVVGAKVYGEDGLIRHAGIVLGVKGLVGQAHWRVPQQDEGYLYRAQVIQNFSAVNGDCMVMRRKVFDELGGFDEKTFPAIYGDLDFCLRAAAAGYRIVWTPYAELCRPNARAVWPDYISEEQARFSEEGERLKVKWRDALAADPYYNPNLSLKEEPFSLAFPPRVIPPWKK